MCNFLSVFVDFILFRQRVTRIICYMVKQSVSLQYD